MDQKFEEQLDLIKEVGLHISELENTIHTEEVRLEAFEAVAKRLHSMPQVTEVLNKSIAEMKKNIQANQMEIEKLKDQLLHS